MQDERSPHDGGQVQEQAYEVLCTPPEQMCLELLRAAVKLLDIPIALLSRIDGERQWFKAKVGLDEVEDPRDIPFCVHTTLEEEMLCVPDALDDPRFAGESLVTGEPGIRSCYGVPLRTPWGHDLGTLCVLDRRPRRFGDRASDLLKLLARQTAWILELRQAGLEVCRAAEAGHQAREFLASMSHELRTPLSAIIGFTSILRRNRSGTLGPRDLDYVERIGANGEYLLRLVNDILDVSKMDAGRMEVDCKPLDLVELVHNLLCEFEGREAKVPVVFDPPPGELPPIIADAHRLRQIILNLVVNAIKFTEVGGVELRILAGDDGVPLRLDVVDSGSGIPPEEQAKIFERHGQAAATRARAGSWGLGLFLSHRLCELMGFSLQVDSKVGEGTTFAVMLDDRAPPPVYWPPRLVLGEADHQPEPACTPCESMSDKTVLVVDDDADARAILESYLEDFGCRVVAVDSGERALEIARQVRPDLITLDLMMPGLDGWTVFQMLREDPELAQIPVAICSVAEIDDESSLPGAIMLDKPVDRRRFHGILEGCFEGRPKETVLIVEPDPERSDIVAQWVSSAGFTPKVVGSEVGTLDALREDKPSLILFGYGPQTHSMLTRLRSTAAGQSLPMALYGFPPGEEPTHDTGIRIIMQRPGTTHIETLLAEHPGATPT